MLKFVFFLGFLAVLTLGKAESDFFNVKDVITQYGGINSTIIMMIDASAKALPDGILRGNFYNFGSYDSCLAIFDHIGGISGKYCYTTLPLAEVIALLSKKKEQLLTTYKKIATKKQNFMDKIKPNLNDGGSSMGFHFGVCIPHTLSVEYLNDKVPGLVFDNDMCYENVLEKKLETKHWIALGVIGMFIMLAILSTFYDIIVSYGGYERYEALSAFSVYTNGKQLFKSSTNEDHLLCINGLRALNMMWVVVGHVFVNFLLSGAIDNWKDAFDWMDNVENMGIMGGTVSVDSFFTIAGLLTVYLYMKSADVDIKKSVKAVPLMYLHRYLRLTPALAIMVLVHATGLIMFLGNGPRWGLLQQFAVEGCEEKWWSTLLYFQNYMNSSERMCIDQSWYLSVDMQLFLLSPLILIPLKKWPIYVLPVMVGLIGAGVAIPFYIGYSNKFTGLVMGSTTAPFREQYYFKTHARFGPYVIGMLTGYFIHKMKSGGKKLKLPSYISFFLWVLAIGAMIGCVFDGYELIEDESKAVLDGLFLGLNRSIWSCAISLVILLCVSGNGGIINTFLSLPIMQLLSKLSYSMYLVHYFIISAVNFSRRNIMHFSTYEALFQFISFFIMTIFVSIVYTLLFESPILILERLLFSKLRK